MTGRFPFQLLIKDLLHLKNHTYLAAASPLSTGFSKNTRRFEFIAHQLRTTLSYVSSDFILLIKLNNAIKHSESVECGCQDNRGPAHPKETIYQDLSFALDMNKLTGRVRVSAVHWPLNSIWLPTSHEPRLSWAADPLSLSSPEQGRRRTPRLASSDFPCDGMCPEEA